MAFAHPGHDSPGFIAGFLHPLTGLDHLVVMLTLGLWAAQSTGRARLALPAAFMAAMLAGALLTAASVTPASVEWVITLSLPAALAAVIYRPRLPLWMACVVVAGFAVAHGMAHAPEVAASLTASYLGGMLLATASLQGAGLWLGKQLRLRLVGRMAS